MGEDAKSVAPRSEVARRARSNMIQIVLQKSSATFLCKKPYSLALGAAPTPPTPPELLQSARELLKREFPTPMMHRHKAI